MDRLKEYCLSTDFSRPINVTISSQCAPLTNVSYLLMVFIFCKTISILTLSSSVRISLYAKAIDRKQSLLHFK